MKMTILSQLLVQVTTGYALEGCGARWGGGGGEGGGGRREYVEVCGGLDQLQGVCSASSLKTKSL